MILGICDNSDILKVIQLIKIVVYAIQIVVPIILIVTISLDFAKGVKDATSPSEILMICKNRIIAAVIIFAVPLIISVLLRIVGDSTTISNCWNNATSSNIKEIEENKKLNFDNTYITKLADRN